MCYNSLRVVFCLYSIHSSIADAGNGAKHTPFWKLQNAMNVQWTNLLKSDLQFCVRLISNQTVDPSLEFLLIPSKLKKPMVAPLKVDLYNYEATF